MRLDDGDDDIVGCLGLAQMCVSIYLLAYLYSIFIEAEMSIGYDYHMNRAFRRLCS
jgi:hypothetical protein